MTIIWTDDTHIELLVNNRTAWRGGWEVIDLLKKLEELDYISVEEYQSEAEYLRDYDRADQP